jgi:hypothetical protein
LANPAHLAEMGKKFHQFARPTAASDMADLVFEAAK